MILFSKRKILFIILIFCAWPIYAQTLYVVVSDNLRGQSFSQAQLKRIFLGEITSINGGRVRLIYPSYSSNAINTLCRFVGKGNVRDLKSYWSKMIFTGRGNPPETANNDAELKRYLDNTDDAIGVATSAQGMNVVYTISG